MIKLCYVIVGLILVIAGNSFFVKKKSNIVSENDTELQKVTETSEILGLYASHKYKEALERCDKAISLYPDNINFLEHRILINMELNDYQAVIDDSNKLISYGVDNTKLNSIYQKQWLSYIQLKQYEQSLSVINKAIELNPDKTELYTLRARSKDFMQDYTGAIADYSKAIDLNPNKKEYYMDRSIIYQKIGDENNAKSDNEKFAILNTESN